jgi:hypothetical protein
MISIKRFSSIIITTLVWVMSAHAQALRVDTVGITAEADKVHIAAQGDVTLMRLEVLDDAGEVVFESGALTGRQLDWKMKDSSGERVAAGTYLLTVTFRGASGKLRKRVEQISIEAGEKPEAQATTADAAPAPNAAQATVVTANPTSAGFIPKFASASSITNSVMIENSTNIGIGGTPRTGWRLDVFGQGLFRTHGRGGPNNTGEIKLGTPNGDTGITFMGYDPSDTNRADLRFDNQYLRLLATVTGNPPSVNNGISISTAGNVGIGAEPISNFRLLLRGGMLAYATQAAAAVQGTAVTTATGLFGRSFQGAGVIGESNAKTIYGVGVAGKNTAGGWAMYAAGNTGQSRAASGWVKALIYINTDHRVVRCFNSTLPDGGASQPPNGKTGCGFKVNDPPTWNTISHVVDFGFKVNDRFVVITPQQSGTVRTGVNFVFTSDPNVIRIDPFASHAPEELAYASVMVVVF